MKLFVPNTYTLQKAHVPMKQIVYCDRRTHGGGSAKHQVAHWILRAPCRLEAFDEGVGQVT